jgi:hypothetical protein
VSFFQNFRKLDQGEGGSFLPAPGEPAQLDPGVPRGGRKSPIINEGYGDEDAAGREERAGYGDAP